MERRSFSPSSATVVEENQSLGVISFPVSKDRQEPAFEDLFKKAYGDFPKLKMYADLHSSEYKNTINLINELPVQLQDKWKLLRLCLWNQYGSSIFGEIFNLTPDKTRKETALLSDLPDKLANMVSELLEERDDGGEEDIAGNITSESSSKRYNIRVNPEKRDFVILAEGGQKWKTLTGKQRIVLAERYLADYPDSTRSLARRLEISSPAVDQIEVQGLRKLGFFGDPISLTRQQLRNLFRNAKADDLNNLTPKEHELLEGLYGANAQAEHSQPTIKSVAADINIASTTAFIRHQKAIQKLLHTKRTIRIDMTLSPTSEQVEFMRQQIPLEGMDKVAKEMGKSAHTVSRWLRQEKIESRPQGRQPISLSLEVLEFIKANYLEMSIVEMAGLTGYRPKIIARSLRAAGIPIGNTTR